jgi:hypothetical protein
MKQTRKGMDRNGSSPFMMERADLSSRYDSASLIGDGRMAKICLPVHDEMETWA